MAVCARSPCSAGSRRRCCASSAAAGFCRTAASSTSSTRMQLGGSSERWQGLGAVVGGHANHRAEMFDAAPAGTLPRSCSTPTLQPTPRACAAAPTSTCRPSSRRCRRSPRSSPSRCCPAAAAAEAPRQRCSCSDSVVNKARVSSSCPPSQCAASCSAAGSGVTYTPPRSSTAPAVLLHHPLLPCLFRSPQPVSVTATCEVQPPAAARFAFAAASPHRHATAAAQSTARVRMAAATSQRSAGGGARAGE